MQNVKSEELRAIHNEWAKWIGINQDDIQPNTIWYALLQMLDNHYTFIGLNKAGLLISPSDDNYFSQNASLSKFIYESYVAYQSLSIRKLVDKRSDVHSIRRLLTALEYNKAFLNREFFVCIDGLPYDFEEGLKAHQAKMIKACIENEGKGLCTEVPLEEHSAYRHNLFDELSGCTERNKSDLVMETYWAKLNEKLNIPELKQIKDYTDKYIAHTADDKSLSKVDKPSLQFTITKIEKCHKALIGVFCTLVKDFWFTTPMLEIGNVCPTYNMDYPFCDEVTKNKVAVFVEEKRKEYRALMGFE